MSKKKEIYVTKASGKKQLFDVEKLKGSLARAGVPEEVEEELIDEVNEMLYDKIPTVQIYNYVLDFLEKSSYPQGRARYSLKQAIMSLGPSGYPFEKFMAELFISQGYDAEVEIIFKGKCSKHEVDVVALKGTKRLMAECKFHNHTGIRTDIKSVLYTKARFDDIMAALKKRKPSFKTNQLCLITNTKFSERAIRYGDCAGMRLIGWNYPEGDSLRDWVEKSRLHPVTCLSSISEAQKARLLDEGIVLCRQLIEIDMRKLKGMGLSSKVANEALREAKLVYAVEKGE